MKRSAKGLFVILAIILSVTAVQSVCAAETFTVTAPIASISERPNVITLDNGTEVYGVRYTYLCNQYNICLMEGETVTLSYYEYECSNGTVKNMAYSITVGDVTVTLRTVP